MSAETYRDDPDSRLANMELVLDEAEKTMIDGINAMIDGTIKASGSFFLNPFKQRSWGAYGTPYNTYRYDTYLYHEAQIRWIGILGTKCR